MQPRVYRLGYVAMNVANFDECVHDATDVTGLRPVEVKPDRAIFTSNTRHAELMLYRASKNEMRSIGLEAYDVASVDRIAARARAAGLTIVGECPASAPVRQNCLN